ncbi:HNH endonuclease signature motif containing protein [Microbacterium testaceum]|uniref:HNH endonuclease signature motif containing protein n=1 Tax=Microbacterium testaceum TaxID=2033 RepID=UPI0022E89D8C|nr:HNH endonuclease signature motif containing protein [Microbacterium testaceum]
MDMSAPIDRLRAASERVIGVLAGREIELLDDRELVHAMAEISAARNALDVLAAYVARVIDVRSTRERGVEGLAQSRGHRNSTELLQALTGQTRRDVIRSVKTGSDLVRPATAESLGGPGTPSVEPAENEPGAGWLERAGGALRDGSLSHAQFHAIRMGLGEPPVERYPELDPDFLAGAWTTAVERLIDEAPHLPVEELRSSARIARDRLDPVGVTLRFEERFAARSFRSWIDEHGQRHGRFVFDDDAAAWVDAVLQAALRPRRGPRFVDAGARVGGARAADASDDRSAEQIAYDTLMAVLRTGAAADPKQAFGDRQPGVRIVVEASARPLTGAGPARVSAGTAARQTVGSIESVETTAGTATRSPGAAGSAETIAGSATRSSPGAADPARVSAENAPRGVGHLEDGGHALPGGVVESYLCDAGGVAVTLDGAGRPLDVGRHHRLFTRAQRIAIAVRDGGCIGIGCRAPISACEMHHIDHWAADRGQTNVDDGVALCRNHHLGLHNRGERIVRERDPQTGRDTYWLHSPPDQRTGESPPPNRLRSRSPRRFTAA